MRPGEDVRGLGHEVNPAEDHELGIVLVRSKTGKAERVASPVGELDDLLTLIVVPEDDEPLAEAGTGRGDAPDQSLGGCRVVVVRKRRLQAEHSVTPCGAPR